MAILFMDSFDHYAIGDILEKGWVYGSTANYDGVVSIGVGEGRNAVNAYKYNSASNLNNRIKPLLIAPYRASLTASGYCSFAYKADILSNSGDNVLFAVNQPVYNNLLYCGSANDGTINLYRSTGLTGYSYSSIATSSGAMTAAAWNYLQFKWYLDDSGYFKVWINGNLVIDYSGDTLVSSAQALWTGISLFQRVDPYIQQALGYAPNSTNKNYWIDDIVIGDLTGSAPGNDVIGDAYIYALYPSGAGSNTNWTPSTGSNYACVDESSPNDDTDYVSATALNTKDTYAYQDAPTGAEIKAIQINTSIRKSVEGPGSIKHVIRSNSTDYDQSQQWISGSTYNYIRSVHELDPNTSAAWTEAGFNAAEFGFKKVG